MAELRGESDTTAPAEPPPSEPPPRWAVPPPPAEVPGAPGLSFADIPARMVAYLVDAIVVGSVGSAAAIALGFGEESVTRTTSYVWVSVPTFAVSFAVTGLVYFVFFWTGGRRATIGQRVFDIQVGNAFDGRPLTLPQALRRWIGYGDFIGVLALVPAIGGFAIAAEAIWGLALLATTARSHTKQGLHDRFARSALVRPSGETSGGPALACLVVVVLVGLLILLALIALVVLVGHIAPIVRPPDTRI